jgi:phage protein D
MSGTKPGSQIVTAAFERSRRFVQVSIPVASQAEADQRAKALLNNLGLEFITGNASTIGVPAVRSGSIVEFQGLGTRFNGEYLVDTARHTIGGSGYQTELTVRRNSCS